MRISLHIVKVDNSVNYSEGKRYRFAVVDLDKAKTYPSNFVCLLPMQMNSKSTKRSIFSQLFGDRGLEQARMLLTKALKKESDPELKAEIERRLGELEPKKDKKVKCCICGKFFVSDRRIIHRQRFCKQCLKKKYGDRA
jgi:hypothetical protein